MVPETLSLFERVKRIAPSPVLGDTVLNRIRSSVINLSYSFCGVGWRGLSSGIKVTFFPKQSHHHTNRYIILEASWAVHNRQKRVSS